MTRQQPGAKLEGDKLTVVDPLGEYSDTDRLATRLYRENLRRGLQRSAPSAVGRSVPGRMRSA